MKWILTKNIYFRMPKKPLVSFTTKLLGARYKDSTLDIGKLPTWEKNNSYKEKSSERYIYLFLFRVQIDHIQSLIFYVDCKLTTQCLKETTCGTV